VTLLELEVGAVAHGGHCVARHEGRVVFVRHALPGERVRARVTEDRERYLRADAVQVLEASPERVEAPCPYARPGRCGGCDWQHAALPYQRELKAAVIREQLARLAKLDVPVVVEAVPGDHGGLGWRTRVRFAVDPSARLALRKHRSHELIQVERCPLGTSGIDDVGATAVTWPGAREVEVVASSGGDRTVLVEPAAAAPDTQPRLRLPALPSARNVVVVGAERPVRGRAWVRESAAGRDWRVDAAGFWQVHPGGADALVSAVLVGLAPQEGESALDLYAGAGLFAGALADGVGENGTVVAVEGSKRAAADARRNLHGSPQVRIEAGSVEKVLARPGWLGLPATDLVVLDPPRTGAGREVVERIVALGPRAVAYVACDPAALARDLATFGEQGYGLRSLKAFDLFPMTHHVECVAILSPS